MRESSIEKTVCAAAKRQGWLVHPKAAAGTRGWPDRAFSKPDRVIFIEFKALKKRPTKLQTHTLEQLKKEGYEVHVIDSIEAGKRIFEQAA